MTHILITGGCGYTGTVLTDSLISDGYKVTVVDTEWFGNYLNKNKNLNTIKLDIRNYDDIPLQGVDIIIHLAGIVNDPSVELNPKLSWEVNVLGGIALIEKCIDNNIKEFIYASSGSVYGVKEELHVTEDLKLLPISTYNSFQAHQRNSLTNPPPSAKNRKK